MLLVLEKCNFSALLVAMWLELYAHGFAVEHLYIISTVSVRVSLILCLGITAMCCRLMKSGKDYDRHSALSNVMDNKEYDIPDAYVFCQDNVQVKGRIVCLPVYMVAFLEQVPESIYKFDLTGLGKSMQK